MKIAQARKILPLILMTAGALWSASAYAGTLTIDNFADAQYLYDRGDSAGANSNTLNGLTGTDLTHVSRTFTALATAGKFANKTEIRSGWDEDAGKNLLTVSNSPRSAGTASIVWNFNAIDFTRFGNAILLGVNFVDLDVNVEMVANGNSSSGIKTFSGNGDFLVNFDDFSNAGAFKDMHSFSLNFTGPAAWDGKFTIMTTYAAPVPVPSAFALMGSALIAMVGVVRRREMACGPA